MKKRRIIVNLYSKKCFTGRTIESRQLKEDVPGAQVYCPTPRHHRATYRFQLESKAPYYPVYSLVLYFGINRWGENQRLSDVVEFSDEYHDHLTDKFSDYKINVLEVAFLSDEEIRKFKSDFRLIAKFFSKSRNNPEYTPSQDTIRHVDEVLTLLRIMTGDSRFEDIVNEKEGSET